jgi:hypothetical protein
MKFQVQFEKAKAGFYNIFVQLIDRFLIYQNQKNLRI